LLGGVFFFERGGGGVIMNYLVSAISSPSLHQRHLLIIIQDDLRLTIVFVVGTIVWGWVSYLTVWICDSKLLDLCIQYFYNVKPVGVVTYNQNNTPKTIRL
jgi:hypothetical protein